MQANKIIGYLLIIRPINVILAGLSVYLGAFIAHGPDASSRVILAMISAALILAAGNVINDYFDVTIDAINKPNRPIPSGRLAPVRALVFAIILFVFGVFLSIFLSLISFGVALFVTFGLLYYSLKLKRSVLWGNLAVSLFSALAFIYGGLAVESWTGSIFPAGFAFLFHLGREIIKDLEDIDADRANEAQTLPVIFGKSNAMIAATVVFSILIVLSLFPYIFGFYNKLYLVIVVLGVDCVILCSLYLLWRFPYPKTLKRLSLVLKADMFVGLMAIILGLPGGRFLL